MINYKKGDYVIIKNYSKDRYWYHNNPMKIINTHYHYDNLILTVDYKFSNNNGDIDNEIAAYHVKRYPMRRNKLKRLLYEN